MNILTNSQVARIFGVSHVTVGNWIKLAIEKKNELEIVDTGKKIAIVDSLKNHKEMELLVSRGSKFRNSSSYKKVSADPRLYQIFSEKNLIELFTELDSKRMIPLKFTYLDNGADLWCEYSKKDIEDTTKSHFKEKVKLFISNIDAILSRFKKYEIINFVDIGPGDGLISVEILKKFLQEGFKVNYQAIDISGRMLEIVKNNFQKELPEINVKTEVNDFDFIIIRDKLFQNKNIYDLKSCNIILFLGSTIGNVLDRHRVLKNFYDSMYKDDYLFMNSTLRYQGYEEDSFRFLNNESINSQFFLDT